MLAQRTGADVAASSDDTGSTNFNGDWDLETHIGEIEARAIDASARDGRLADPVNLAFTGTPTLVSGTARTERAIYRYNNVSTGIDALVTVTRISNATLDVFDDSSGVDRAFQPSITGQANNNNSSFVEFSFCFEETVRPTRESPHGLGGGPDRRGGAPDLRPAAAARGT